MSDREKRQARKNWREYSNKSYKKKKLKTNMTNQFIRENTPSSLNDEPVSPGFHNLEQAQQEILNVNVSQPPTPNLRLQSARKRSRLQRFNRNQELKRKNVLIVSLKQKLNKYKKRCQRLKKQKKQLELTPNTAMTKLAEDPTTRPDVVKKALFGDALEKQISDNMTNLKTRQEKEVTNQLLLGETVKVKKATNYKKGNSKDNNNLKKGSESKKAKKNKKYEFIDCECLICGVLYSEDTTGNDWVQCLVCHNWAQDGCIKGESTLFKCSDCLADCDYKK